MFQNLRPWLLLVAIVLLSVNEAMAKIPSAGMAEVNGGKLFYEVKGKGFPLVFVSGGGILDRRGWDEQFLVFSKHFKVIRYDVRGIGKSTRPAGPFSHSDDLQALLRFLGVKRTHVVALSVGGAIAIDFTLEHPEMVDHLILAASGLSDDAKADANQQGLAALANLTRMEGLERVIQLTLDAPFVITKENAAAREKIRGIYLSNRDVFEAGFPIYSLWQPVQPPASARLSEIRAQSLIIRGDKDNPVYLALTEKVSRGIKGAQTLIIPGGTHFINLDKPKEFNQAALKFLGIGMKPRQQNVN